MKEQFAKLATDPALANSVIYFVFALAGQMFYAVHQWARKEIDCVMDRFRNDPRSSVAAIIGNVTAMVGVIAMLPMDQMPLQAVVITAFLQGISADSTLNKNVRAVWTEEQRAAASTVKPNGA